MDWASSSLPVPLSPVTSTVELTPATARAMSTARASAGLRPVSVENAAEVAGSYTPVTLPLVMQAAKEAGLLSQDVDLGKATDPQYLG